MKMYVVWHVCVPTGDPIQELIYVPEEGTATYVCSECSGVFFVTADGKIIDQQFNVMGQWQETLTGSDQFSRIETMEPLRYARNLDE